MEAALSYNITNDTEHRQAIAQMIALEKDNENGKNEDRINEIGDAVVKYEESQGHTPEPPRTLQGILEVEMYKRRMNQRALAKALEITETRLSEFMRGKRELNIDLAKKIHVILGIDGNIILELTTNAELLEKNVKGMQLTQPSHSEWDYLRKPL
ncbi:helix-turn-helix domain-containing protein [Hymenobacter aerilatus]|uniref:Helix-turn-helix domain-containing protein n=1 Tax=Hymenobacter aerilatus TaxID=2932251 RepID=A0A8T9T5W3_9BACT|nr:helix-turn-helix domain-containing protein [Hymenobacter aerilatus]UOR07466.1 helix-turn-helix domain-containing protein [Hymenobacter aerilatus]